MGRAVRLVFAFFLGIALVSNAAGSNHKHIYIVTHERSEILNSLRDALQTRFDANSITIIDTSEDSIPKDKNAVFLAAGPRALSELLDQPAPAHVISTFNSRVSFQSALRYDDSGRHPKNLSAIYADPTPDKQIHLIRALFKRSVRVAVIVSDRTEFLLEPINQAAKRHDLRIKVIKHYVGSDIRTTLRDLTNVDVLLALPDKDIYNGRTIKTIINAAYRKEIPVIGYSRQVVQAGALATTYYDIESLNAATVNAVEHYLTTGVLSEPESPSISRVQTNPYVRRSFNIDISDDELGRTINTIGSDP